MAFFVLYKPKKNHLSFVDIKFNFFGISVCSEILPFFRISLTITPSSMTINKIQIYFSVPQEVAILMANHVFMFNF